jgi:UDPglucose 6-dehydrogenase
MSYESAELTKLSANFVLAANITAANSLADLAARLGANWQHIEAALRDDQRIGQKAYISAGLGIGGANLSRDLHGIRDMANRLGADAHLAETMLHHSDYMRNWVLRVITQLRQQEGIERLAVLGLAYKPGTQSTRGGAGIDLVNLLGTSVSIVVYDPAVRLPEPSPSAGLSQAVSIAACLEGADVIAVTTPYPEFREALSHHLAMSPSAVVVDPYRLADPAWAAGSSTRLIQLGVADV